jgi:hypothetical protein
VQTPAAGSILGRAVPCSRLRKADESIPDTKGRESRTPTDFPLHNSRFWGPQEGTIIAILDPWQTDAVMECEVHARCGGSCARREKAGRRDHSGPQRARIMDPKAFSPA